jgi:SAM-dependent methyltransferase
MSRNCPAPKQTDSPIGDVQRSCDALWNGEKGAGGISWLDRSRMGLLRGVIDAADERGRRNLYMHTLDFGCGTGRFLKILSEYGADVYAVDKESCMVEAARKYAGAYAKDIESCSPDRLSFEAAFFDASLIEMARLLRPSGTLLLLEQVAPKRGLTLFRYFQALRGAGFSTGDNAYVEYAIVARRCKTCRETH